MIKLQADNYLLQDLLFSSARILPLAPFTEEQIIEIKQLIQDSVTSVARDIAREAARVATGAMQSHIQAPPSPVTKSSQAVIQNTRGVQPF